MAPVTQQFEDLELDFAVHVEGVKQVTVNQQVVATFLSQREKPLELSHHVLVELGTTVECGSRRTFDPQMEVAYVHNSHCYSFVRTSCNMYITPSRMLPNVVPIFLTLTVSDFNSCCCKASNDITVHSLASV